MGSVISAQRRELQRIFRHDPVRSLQAAGSAGLLALLLALLVGCGGDPAYRVPEDTAVRTRDYRVGPPDQLFITILPDPAIERAVVVRPDGMVSIDLIGDLPAAGRSTEEIAADIEQRIARYKRGARVTVSVVAPLSATITVLGEVRAPSTLPLERELRVAEIIGLVGGPTNFAATNRIRVVRHNGESVQMYRTNLDDIEDGNLTTNILVQAGDIVIVPRTRFAVAGFAIQEFFFPLQQLLGIGATFVNTVVTGGRGNTVD